VKPEREELRIRGGYPNIPDHSDLRGFSYRGPENYEWFDDHDEPGPPRTEKHDLWKSLQTFFGRGPKGYRRPDERIREDACEALARHPGIDASEMEVDVRNGIVWLSGKVPDRWMKRAAEWVIDRITGVVDIRNELRVQRNPGEERALWEIKAREERNGLTPL
jgi:hypothetical protein